MLQAVFGAPCCPAPVRKLVLKNPSGTPQAVSTPNPPPSHTYTYTYITNAHVPDHRPHGTPQKGHTVMSHRVSE
jgi:hypothetical protein